MKLKKHYYRISALLITFCLLVVSSFTTKIYTLAMTATTLDISKGDIIISRDTISGKAPDGSNVTIVDSEGYIIVGTTTVNKIIVESGAVNLFLQDVNIQMNNAAPAISVKSGADLTLDIDGVNILVGGGGYAAISVAPAYDAESDYSTADSAALTLTGDGTLSATGGMGLAKEYGGGAGIGGDGQNKGIGVDFGSIVISDNFTGKLTAKGGSDGATTNNMYGGGAGIGSGGMSGSTYYWDTVYGNISIQNGNIVALSNGSGAGIGGGGAIGGDTVASQMEINISGGTVAATGGTLGAGIGGGTNCDGGFISISDGIVTAQAGSNSGSIGAAGIGGGDNAAPSSVIITGGTVTAIAQGGAAGIGGGTNTPYSYVFDYDNDINGHVGNKGIIAISGENTTVYAYGGTGIGSTGTFGGAGIGSGYPTANNQRSVAFDISITNKAVVYSHGGYHSQAIGYGFRPNTTAPANYYTGYGIKLKLDSTIILWALNADFHQTALVAVTPYDANPITYVDDNTYLVCYTDVNNAATSASAATAVGRLDMSIPDDSVEIGWSFSTPILTLTLNENSYDMTTDAKPEYTEITGNWAALFPTSATQTGNLTVSKRVTGDAADMNKAFTFTVTLGDMTINGEYGNLTFINGVATFTLKHGDSKTASELPADIAYTVTESDNAGYTVKKTNETGAIPANETATVTFINNKSGGTTSQIPEVISKTVRKVWDDNNDQDKIRPNSILVQLKANGSNVGSPITLNSENNWSYTWGDLPSFNNGTVIKYTAEELDVPVGYTARYSTDTYTITNIHIPSLTKQEVLLYVNKVLTNPDGERIGNGKTFTVQIIDSEKNIVAAIDLAANDSPQEIRGLESGKVYTIGEMSGELFTFKGFNINGGEIIKKDVLTFRVTLSSKDVAGRVYITLNNEMREEDIDKEDQFKEFLWPDDNEIIDILPEDIPLTQPNIPGTGDEGINKKYMWLLISISMVGILVITSAGRKKARQR